MEEYKKIRILMIERDLSLAETAEQIGCTWQYLSSIVNNRVTPGKAISLAIQEWAGGPDKVNAVRLMGM